MYSDLSHKYYYYDDSEDSTLKYSASGKAYGVNVAYKMDALTLSMGAAQAKFDGMKQTSFGVGAAYDLGGGATLKGGIASIKDQFAEENVYAEKETRADFGISFSF